MRFFFWFLAAIVLLHASSGVAHAQLGPTVRLAKSFSISSVAPGGSVVLEFQIENADEATPVTGLSFTDDLAAMVAGVSALGLPANDVCGAGSQLSGTTNLSFTGGSLDGGGTCSFSVTLDVSSAVAAGTYVNTTSVLAGTGGGLPIVGNAASNNLVVSNLFFNKQFVGDPVVPGSLVALQFTINNTDPANAATAVTFSDNLSSTLSGLVATGNVISDSCGGAIVGTSNLLYSGGTVPAAGSCTISIELSVPPTAAPGEYNNTTSALTANLVGPIVVAPATDRLSIVSSTNGLTLTKDFTNDPVEAGDLVTLQFTLDNAGGDATAISFTDDLDAMLSGATATVLPAAGFCGASSTVSGTSTLTFSGAEVLSGQNCTFSVTVQVPSGAAANVYTNTTSSVSATVGGISGTSDPATAQLTIAAGTATFTKAFIDDPVPAGGTVSLQFTITNNGALPLNDVRFVDNLGATLSGLQVSSLPSGPCGAGSQITGTTVLTFSGGALGVGQTCDFVVQLQIPAGAAVGNYPSSTTDLFESGLLIGTAAGDTLQIANPAIMTVTPAGNLTSTGFQGGPFAPSSAQYTVTNSGGAPITFTVSDNAAFVDVSTAGGTLAAGASTTVTVSFNAAANALSPGIHSGTVTFTNTTNGNGNTTRGIALEVLAPGKVILAIETQGGDVTVDFTSASAALVQSLTSVGGSAQSAAITLPAGTHVVTAADLSGQGFGYTSIDCDDAGATTDLAARSATIAIAGGKVITCTFSLVSSLDRTTEVINSFLTHRTNLLLSEQPGENRRFDRLNGGGSTSGVSSHVSPMDLVPVSVRLSGEESFSFSTSLNQVRKTLSTWRGGAKSPLAEEADLSEALDASRFDIWAEGTMLNFKDSGGGGTDGHFGVFYFGADYLLTPDLLVGALIQFDDMEESNSAFGSSVSGTGWMAGPYLTARIGERLLFDVRAEWGQSDNKISPFGTYTDNFETTRWLASASVTGDFSQGDMIIRPNARISFIEETQHAYVDTLNVTIPEQTVTFGQARFGPYFAYRFRNANGGSFEPNISFEGIYNFGETRGVPIANEPTNTDGLRGRVTGGFNLTTSEGVRLGVNGFFDGIGSDGYSAYGVKGSLTVPLY